MSKICLEDNIQEDDHPGIPLAGYYLDLVLEIGNAKYKTVNGMGKSNYESCKAYWEKDADLGCPDASRGDLNTFSEDVCSASIGRAFQGFTEHTQKSDEQTNIHFYNFYNTLKPKICFISRLVNLSILLEISKRSLQIA